MKDITSVERASSMQEGRFAVMRIGKYGEGNVQCFFPSRRRVYPVT